MNSVWLKRFMVTLPVVFACGEAFAFDWSDLWLRPDQRAYELLQQGDSTSAAEKFTDPQWRGVSHYRAGEFEQAQQEFSNLEGDAGLYNQGVTAVQQEDFDTAIEKFESLLKRSPDHADGQHNLEIARELAKQQEQQEEQQQDGDQQQGGDQQEDGDQQEGGDQSQQDQSESEGEQQADGDPGDEQGDAEEDDQRGGELAADPDDAASDDQEPESDQDSQSGEQQQDPQDQQSQQQQGGSEDGGDEQQQPSSMVPAGPSESEQATEQWLRRIPDDPSQLLRNKIKLNHMIEHSEVQDMQEPW